MAYIFANPQSLGVILISEGRSIYTGPGDPGYAEALATGPAPYAGPVEDAPLDPAAALALERAAMVCTRRQGKTAIGAALWARAEAIAADPETPWAMGVAILDADIWERLSPEMDALAWALGLEPVEVDALFRLAVSL
jgi:hypothetical protein